MQAFKFGKCTKLYFAKLGPNFAVRLMQQFTLPIMKFYNFAKLFPYCVNIFDIVRHDIPEYSELTQLQLNVDIDTETSLYPFMSVTLSNAISALSKQVTLAPDVSNFDFFLELPYKVTIETPVNAYHEDITIMEKKVMAISKGERVYCNIELKKTVTMSLRRVEINDLIETLLYSLYYFQEHRATNKIISVLTDYHIWHIFILRYDTENNNLKLLHYYTFSATDTSVIQNYVYSFLKLIKETFDH